jgi:hypothetical protein
MSKHLEQLEKILGARIERLDARVIPGTVNVEGQRTVYFLDDKKNSFSKQFRKVTTYTNPPHAKSGGVNERGCEITLPNAQRFFAISYHGDLEGWKKDIEAGAQALSLLLAEISDNNFVISDGRVVSLEDCEVKFS